MYDPGSPAPAAAPETPTPLELLDQLAKALDRLETQIDQLAERLDPVLIEPEPSAPRLEPVPGRTRLSQHLTHLAAYAERLAEIVNTLRARVEL